MVIVPFGLSIEFEKGGHGRFTIRIRLLIAH